MRILITAGPTIERIDPVRFLSNRSTGKMGYALTLAAVERGFETTLVSGPTALPQPHGLAEFVRIESAAEMAAEVKSRAIFCDVIIMAAAVADYRPIEVSSQKIKKGDGKFALVLERTEDILASLGKCKTDKQILVGFAAETENLTLNARKKLLNKNLDWIAANKVEDSFGKDTNIVTLYGRNSEKIEFAPCSKIELAKQILKVIAPLA